MWRGGFYLLEERMIPPCGTWWDCESIHNAFHGIICLFSAKSAILRERIAAAFAAARVHSAALSYLFGLLDFVQYRFSCSILFKSAALLQKR